MRTEPSSARTAAPSWATTARSWRRCRAASWSRSRRPSSRSPRDPRRRLKSGSATRATSSTSTRSRSRASRPPGRSPSRARFPCFPTRRGSPPFASGRPDPRRSPPDASRSPSRCSRRRRRRSRRARKGAIDVAAIQEAGLAITPHTARGGESATYRLLLQNKGNAPLQVTLDASDPDELLTFEFDRPSLTLGRGEAVNVQLVVGPRATFYDGPPQPHAFKVQLSSDGVAPVSADATLLQEAIPRPARKKFPLIPVLVGVLALGLLTGMVIERDPLMQLVGLKTSAQVAPNTGGTPTVSPTVSASVTVSAPPLQAVTGTIPNVTCTNAIAR